MGVEAGTAEARGLFSRGCRLLEAGEPGRAAHCLLRASELAPDRPAILVSLATAYHHSRQHIAALKVYDRLIELGKATAKTWCATGNLLTDVGEYAQAVAAYEHSMAAERADPEAHHNLARVLYRLGEVERAVYHLEYSANRCQAIAPWLSLASIIPGSVGADLSRILEVRKKLAAKLAACAGRDSAEAFNVQPGPGSLPHIGYLSAFFHAANYMKPVWGLINHHDRSVFEIHLFSDSPGGHEWQGYRPHCRDRIHETNTLDNDELASLIQASGIDLLVDLNAFSCPERLALFLSRPAPVTVGWFNWYATSGLPGFDYLIGDDEVVRPEEEPFFAERVHRLPISYLTFQVDHPTPPVVPPPCLKNGFLTFGSLVSQYKITPPVLDVWATILKRTEGSRLLLANAALKSLHNRRYLAEKFAERGADTKRLILCGPADHFTFLANYDRIDVALDAFPYNGGTTTMEAIWQGVPVLTFRGDRWASRTSQSLLCRTHLQDFVAESAEGMVDYAVNLARSRDAPSRLGELRRTMRATLKNQSACDSAALARAMEEFFRTVLGI